MPPTAPLVGCACDLCDQRRAAAAGGAAAPARIDLRADALLLLHAADEVHAASAAAGLPPQAARQLEQLSCVCSSLVGRERLKGAGAGEAVRALRRWGTWLGLGQPYPYP